MKTEFIWRNCLVKELNIPDPWKNLDGLECDPPRQDLFWVACSKEEVLEIVAKAVRSIGHVLKIAESVQNSPATEFHFLISRDLKYVQYYPYLNMSTSGSLWQKFNETEFSELAQLNYIELK